MSYQKDDTITVSMYNVKHSKYNKVDPDVTEKYITVDPLWKNEMKQFRIEYD